MFELSLKQGIKSGRLAMEGRTFQAVRTEKTVMPNTNRPHFLLLLTKSALAMQSSWCSSNRAGSSNRQSLVRAFALLLLLLGMTFPQILKRLAALSPASLCSNVTFSVRTCYSILKCQPCTPNLSSLFCFVHSMYYYLTWCIVYFILMLSIPLPKEQKSFFYLQVFKDHLHTVDMKSVIC